MKPLKDIGHPCNLLCTRGWLHTPGFVSEVKEISHKFFCEHETQENVPAIAYSLEERRELVREAIMKWERTKWERLVTRDNLEKWPDMNEFLKSEGL